MPSAEAIVDNGIHYVHSYEGQLRKLQPHYVFRDQSANDDERVAKHNAQRKNAMRTPAVNVQSYGEHVHTKRQSRAIV